MKWKQIILPPGIKEAKPPPKTAKCYVEMITAENLANKTHDDHIFEIRILVFEKTRILG